MDAGIQREIRALPGNTVREIRARNESGLLCYLCRRRRNVQVYSVDYLTAATTDNLISVRHGDRIMRPDHHGGKGEYLLHLTSCCHLVRRW